MPSPRAPRPTRLNKMTTVLSHENYVFIDDLVGDEKTKSRSSAVNRMVTVMRERYQAGDTDWLDAEAED